jgi:hypothetical protein
MKLYVHTVLSLRRKKTPSLLFMLREEYPYSVKNKHPISVKTLCFISNGSPLILELMKLYFFKTYFVPWHNFFEIFSEDQHCIPFLCHWCNMMYDVMLCEWCDDVMLCKMIFVPKIHTHSHSRTHNLFVVYFLASPLIFRCISVDFSL